ncbi:hypothetical protein [Consotaella aegiceratis]|uniref:hypothetical protein n=1 Tax=Consotaella aegiceratis TaxID=3097961 RepID=UPI002F3E5D33
MAWFLELGAAENFELVWSNLRIHYKPELRAMMDLAVATGAGSRRNESDVDDRQFFAKVGDLMRAPGILRYYDECFATA